jgi:hypothetical protein
MLKRLSLLLLIVLSFVSVSWASGMFVDAYGQWEPDILTNGVTPYHVNSDWVIEAGNVDRFVESAGFFRASDTNDPFVESQIINNYVAEESGTFIYKFSLGATDHRLGLIFKWDDFDSYYYVKFEESTNDLYVVKNDNGVVTETRIGASGVGLIPVENELKIVYINNSYEFIIDNASSVTSIGTFTDATITGGRFGYINSENYTVVPTLKVFTIMWEGEQGSSDAPEVFDTTLTVNEDDTYAFSSSSFDYENDASAGEDDTEKGALASVVIKTFSGSGALKLNGTTVNNDDVIVESELSNLVFTPNANENSLGYASITYQVSTASTICGGYETWSAGWSAEVRDWDDYELGYKMKLNDTLWRMKHMGYVSTAPTWRVGYDDGGAGWDVEGGCSGVGQISANIATITIDVNPINDAPSFTIVGDLTNDEDEGAGSAITVAGWATGYDDGEAIETQAIDSYIVTNNNGALFSTPPAIATNGDLTYTLAENAFGVATVSVKVKDNGGTANNGIDTSGAQIFTITVTAVNDAPVISGSATSSVAENSTAVQTLSATDIEGNGLTYTVSGGADASFFDIDGTSGALSFIAARDFEDAKDNGTDNIYNVDVTVTDNGTPNKSDVISVAVNINPVNDIAPVITATQVFSIDEDAADNDGVGTVVVTDGDLGAVTNYSAWTITDGNTGSVFSIDATSGVITIGDNTNLNYESVTSYTLTLTVSDDVNTSFSEDVIISIGNVNESPTLDSPTAVSILENTKLVQTVVATDVDAGDGQVYSITSGADQNWFEINETTGVLSFTADKVPDYEASPGNGATGDDNVYEVEVTVTDNDGLTDVHTVSVTVDDVTGIVIEGDATKGISVNENTVEVDTVVAASEGIDAPKYTITGAVDDALFSIDEDSGILEFVSAPNFELPNDQNGDGDYVVEVTATVLNPDFLTDVQTITITVDDINDAPIFNTATTVSVDENITAVQTVDADDEDGDGLTYTISGGADASKFDIDGASGVLVFNTAPNFENKIDANGDNEYVVEVTVTDDGAGTLTDVHTITVTVTNINETPQRVSLIDDITILDSETDTIVATITDIFSDVDAGDNLTYSILGDSKVGVTIISNELHIAAVVGQIGVDNIIITAKDSQNETVTDTFSVTVVQGNQAPAVSTSITNLVEQEDFRKTTIVDLSNHFADGDGDDITYTISYTPANIATLEIDGDEIDATSVENIYGEITVIVTAKDPSLASISDTFNLTVTPVNDAPVATLIDDQTTAVNSLFELTLTGSDAESSEITWELMEAPAGMTLDENNQISWTPSSNSLGHHMVEVNLSDPQGVTTEMTFVVVVDREISILKSGSSLDPKHITISPTILTGDGRKMEFRVHNTDIRNISISIFDALGSELFSVESEQYYMYRSVASVAVAVWDGRNRNGRRVTGSCVAVITVEMKNGHREQIKRMIGVRN